MSTDCIEEASKITNEQMTNDMLRKELFMKAMNGKWEEVVKIHEQDRRAYKIKITTSGETALHLAIREFKTEHVEKLVNWLINKRDKNDNFFHDDVASEAKEILRIEDKRGHTPLHIAAANGSLTMCRCIARVDKSLVLVRDKKGQTPLYRAVYYGQKQTFLYLHSEVFGAHDCAVGDIKHCYRDDGQTILQCAIIKENFDLAFQIIHLYKELVNYADKEGESPLHALARKSHAFKSGNNLQGRDKVIYNCMSVKEHEVDHKALEKYSDPEFGLKDKNHNPPENKRSTNFLNSVGLLFRNVTQVGRAIKKECANFDIETREERIHHTGSDNANQRRQPYFCAGDIRGCFESVKPACGAILPMVLGYGHTSMNKIRIAKTKHVGAVQVLNELLNHATLYDRDEDLRLSQIRSKGGTKNKFQDNSDAQDLINQDNSDNSDEECQENTSASSKISALSGYTKNLEAAGKEECSRKETKDTPILVAAKFGVAEMVEEILERFPVAILDKDKDRKTVLLATLEKRNLQVYKILIKKCHQKQLVFMRVDRNGNTALHYAAMYAEHIKPWPVPGAALQILWEIKWHEFVENTMPLHLYLQTNLKGQTPSEMFSNTHKDLVKAGSEWLTNTATSCSVVATLIATVAFASSTTAPGGTDNRSGKPMLERSPTFIMFAISSLVALCFSVTSLIMFLAILTSRHQEKDFGDALPRKILFGLTSLFVSIASMLVTFCAGHFLVFEDNIKYAALPVYAVTLLPLCLFAAAQFPLYFDLLKATFWSPF